MNNLEQNTNATLYTTPKMAVGSVVSDILWQVFSQYLDPKYEDASIGKMNAVDFSGIFYPFLMTAIIYAISRQYSLHNAKHADEEAKKSDLAEDQAIAAGVFLGMAGWMAGYFLSQELDFGRWEEGAVIGMGSAIPMLLYSIYTDSKANKTASVGTYAVAGLSFFLGGLSWYVSYMLPGIMMNHGFSENHVAGGCVSALATGVGSVASLGILYLWENRGQKDKSVPQLAPALH